MANSAIKESNRNAGAEGDAQSSSTEDVKEANENGTSQKSGSTTGVIVKVEKVTFAACLRFRIRPEQRLTFFALSKAPKVRLDLTATFKTVGGTTRSLTNLYYLCLPPQS